MPVQSFPKMIRAHALNVMNNEDLAAIYNNEDSELTPTQRQQLNRMNRNYDAMFESVYQRGVTVGAFRNIPAHVAVGTCSVCAIGCTPGSVLLEPGYGITPPLQGDDTWHISSALVPCTCR